MGAGWLYFWLLASQRKNRDSNETAFATVLWMMYLMIGGILVGHGTTVDILPFIPSLLGWLLCQGIVLRWSIKQNTKWNMAQRKKVIK